MRFSIHKQAIALLLLTALFVINIPSVSYAEIGPGITNNVDGTKVISQTGAPGTITNVKPFENLDLDAAVEKAGLLELGEGNTPPDSILGEVPMLHYGMWNVNNAEITGTESNLNTYIYNKEGFSRLYLNHSGIARYYYRAYTKNQGWFPWSNSGEPTPNNDDNDKIQAIQIRVKGYTKERTDIYYKVVLNDGTILDWAKNGETAGTIGTDKFIVAIKIALWNKEHAFPGKTQILMQAAAYEGVYLNNDGAVAYSKADGSAYTGWAMLNDNQYYFKDNVLLKGWNYIDGYKYYMNEDGSVLKDLEPILGHTDDYAIKYNKSTKTMYIMAKDGNNGHIIPYKTFMSSCGPDTPLGYYKTYVKYNWKLMHDNIYCQYLSRFKGSFLIHSIIYYDKPSPFNLDSSTYNYMDDAISGGCIRLLTGDAAWIYNNCKLGTPVIIYEDQWNKGPIEKGAITKPISRSQNFDPTDPFILNQNR